MSEMGIFQQKATEMMIVSLFNSKFTIGIIMTDICIVEFSLLLLLLFLFLFLLCVYTCTVSKVCDVVDRLGGWLAQVQSEAKIKEGLTTEQLSCLLQLADACQGLVDHVEKLKTMIALLLQDNASL